MTIQYEHDPAEKESLLTYYLYAKEKLNMPEDEARKFACDQTMRARFFFEAFRLPQNISLKILYFIPKLLFFILLLIGFILKTNWWFYTPALFFLLFWVYDRKRGAFWIPLLYWLKPFLEDRAITESDKNPTDWRSYFLLPYPQGRANIKQMINSTYELVQLFGHRILVRSFFSSHILFLGGFTVLAYLAWRS